MLERVIIHIGAEKTGSTSIQEFLHLNSSTLDSIGYHVLQCAGPRSHPRLPMYVTTSEVVPYYFARRGIRNEQQLAEFREAFARELHGEMRELTTHVKAVIISSEHFHSKLKTDSAVEDLKALLSPYTRSCEVICYIREQSQLAESSYSTKIMTGYDHAFGTFLKQCDPEDSFYNYSKLITRWERVFSPESMKLRIFEPEFLHNSSLVDDFLYCIDRNLSIQNFIIPSVENRSFSRTGKAVSRAINNRFPPHKAGHKNLSQVGLLALVRKHFLGKDYLVTRKSYEEIRASFEQSNMEIRDKYFPERETLFSDRTVFAKNPERLETSYFLFKALLTLFWPKWLEELITKNP